jgi:hypothetical protein
LVVYNPTEQFPAEGSLSLFIPYHQKMKFFCVFDRCANDRENLKNYGTKASTSTYPAFKNKSSDTIILFTELVMNLLSFLQFTFSVLKRRLSGYGASTK